MESIKGTTQCTVNNTHDNIMWWPSEYMGRHTYIYKADVEFLSCVSSLEIAPGIHVIVTDNSGDDV